MRFGAGTAGSKGIPREVIPGFPLDIGDDTFTAGVILNEPDRFGLDAGDDTFAAGIRLHTALDVSDDVFSARMRARFELDIGDETFTAGGSQVFANGYEIRRDIVLRPPITDRIGAIALIALVSLEENDLRSVANGGSVAAGTHLDIRFEASGTRLAHDVEAYDPATGRLVAWVLVPSWDLTGLSSIEMYYGKSGLTAAETQATSVWAGNSGRWQFPSGADRTVNGRGFTPESGTLGTGAMIGPAGVFVSGDTMAISDPAFLDGHAGRSVSWSMSPASSIVASGSDVRIIVQGDPTAAGMGGRGFLFGFDAVGFYGNQAGRSANNCLVVNLLTTEGRVRIETAANTQASGFQVFHYVWRPGELPKLFRNGIEMAYVWRGLVSADETVVTENGVTTTSAVTVSDNAFPLRVGVQYAGLFGDLLISSTSWPDRRARIAGIMQRWPRSTAGVSSSYTATSVAKIQAVPDVYTATAGATRQLELIGNDTGAITSITADSPSFAGGTVASTATLGTVDYTPPSGFSGFDITPYLAVGGGKQSKGAAIIWVSDGGTTNVSELPSALRTLTNGTTGIHNHSQLMAAHDISQPGDEIILENDFTSSTTFTPTRFGTQTAPIVYRGRVGTAIAPKMTGQLMFGAATQDLWFYGIDFTGAQNSQVRGNRLRFRRCHFWPNNPNHSGSTFAIHLGGRDGGGTGGRDIRFDYCTFRLSTQTETPGTWVYNSTYGSVRTYVQDWKPEQWVYDVVFERCLNVGGLYDTPYGYPNHQSHEFDTNPQATGIDVNWIFGNCYTEMTYKYSILDLKTGGMHILGCIFDTPNGQIQAREHQNQRIQGVNSTGRIAVARGPNKRILDSAFNEIWLIAGKLPWDDEAASTARQTLQRPSYQGLVSNCTITAGSGLVVGQDYNDSAYIYPADQNVIEACNRAPVLDLQTNTTVRSTTSRTGLWTPASFAKSSCGHAAPWVGLEY